MAGTSFRVAGPSVVVGRSPDCTIAIADPSLSRQHFELASDAGVKIVDDLYGDSLGAPGSGADTIDGMLLTNARKIADALK